MDTIDFTFTFSGKKQFMYLIILFCLNIVLQMGNNQVIVIGRKLKLLLRPD